MWNYSTRHVDRGLDVTSVREVSGHINSAHVCLESFRIVDRHFCEFARLGLHAELFQQRQIGIASDEHKNNIVRNRQRLAVSVVNVTSVS